VKEIQSNYTHVYVHNSFVPVYWFLYLPYNPADLQKSGHNDRQFWKVVYTDLSKDPLKTNIREKILVIAPFWYENKSYELLNVVKLVNGDTVFKIYEY
jgi:hypothetical protein